MLKHNNKMTTPLSTVTTGITGTTVSSISSANTIYGASGAWASGSGGGAGGNMNSAYYGSAQPGQYIVSNGSSATWTLPNHKVSPLVINGPGNKELVRINHDGSVTWADTIDIDKAVKAFEQTLTISTETAAGLTYAVKQRMRDTVFEEIISMAKDKGSLTADDLTYLHQAAKIMDKLKGKE